MQLTPSTKPIVLQAQTLIGFKKAKNSQIKVIRGKAWITVEGEFGDIILEQGGVFKMPNNALTLLETSAECEVAFYPPETFMTLLRDWVLGMWSRRRNVISSYQPDLISVPCPYAATEPA